MILNADVATHVATTFFGDEDIDKFAIEDDGDFFVGADDLIVIPLADFHGVRDGALDLIDGAGLVFSDFVACNLDFVSLLDRDPRVVFGIREADENA